MDYIALSVAFNINNNKMGKMVLKRATELKLILEEKQVHGKTEYLV